MKKSKFSEAQVAFVLRQAAEGAMDALARVAQRLDVPDAAQRITNEWREALRLVGVSGSAARDYELAFVNDQTEIALGL